jgi:hypothetical protein
LNLKFNIDERIDTIGDGPLDLKNGTVDFDDLDNDENFDSVKPYGS